MPVAVATAGHCSHADTIANLDLKLQDIGSAHRLPLRRCGWSPAPRMHVRVHAIDASAIAPYSHALITGSTPPAGPLLRTWPSATERQPRCHACTVTVTQDSGG